MDELIKPEKEHKAIFYLECYLSRPDKSNPVNWRKNFGYFRKESISMMIDELTELDDHDFDFLSKLQKSIHKITLSCSDLGHWDRYYFPREDYSKNPTPPK